MLVNAANSSSLYSRFGISAYTKRKFYYKYVNESLEYPKTVLIAMLNQDIGKAVVMFHNQFELTTEHSFII